MTGILSVTNGESRINGVLLARDGSGDPFGNATQFLSDNDCDDGDCVTVTGTQRSKGFFIDTAVKESSSKCARAGAATEEMVAGVSERALSAPASAKAAPSKAKAKAKGPKTSTSKAAPKKAKKSGAKKSKGRSAGRAAKKGAGGKRSAKRPSRGRGK